MTSDDQGLKSRVGPVEIDWPRSVGYYGGLAAAVGTGLIEPPLGVFIAAIPFLKMLNRPEASRPTRFVAQLLDGASKPVGGDSDAAITAVTDRPLDTPARPRRGLSGYLERELRSIWTEAQALR